MDTDCHGIAHQFEDAFGVLRVTSRETRDAIRGAMNVEGSERLPARIKVIDRRRRGALKVGTGELHLEDGARISIVDRLPPDVPFGYHDFLPLGSSEPIRLIVSPGRCPAPPGRHIWGWAVQLYAARSKASWGMGDMADLRTLCDWSKELGARFLLVNPLPAVDPVVPQEASPYYPSSRRFRNPLYIHVENVPGASEVGADLERIAALGRQLNEQPRIRRDEIFALKQQALESIFARFHGDAALDRFRREQGPALRQFATYCVLVEKLGADWSRWPAEFQRPEAPGVTPFAVEHARRVEFHEWLQWVLDEQLAAAATLGIVQDMPIGIATRGADAWTWQDVLGDGVSVGAPPDMYNTMGQNWGIPPWVPERLRAARYVPFIETIRALLRHAGGLRIDHVMGLFRLFWIPQGMSPVDGTYVEYPAEDLLNIVALESHRAGAFVVGEDLGTVGKNVRQMLAAAHILSNRLLWFESHPPRDYPRLALAAVTTHDLPTIAGLWTGNDLAAQQALGLQPNAEATEAIRDRLREMTGLTDSAVAPDVVRATYRLLGEAPSALVAATLEDAVAAVERPNMPATVHQWPNWCIPLSEPLDSLVQAPLPRDIAKSLSQRGKRAGRASAAPRSSGVNGRETEGTSEPAATIDKV